MINILIIEDEINTSNELQAIIKQAPFNVNVVGALTSVSEAQDWLKKNESPDLLFSDIALTDGTCFDLFDVYQPDCPVIFCTAYDNYAIKAFENNGIDYILKPFDDEKIFQSINKFMSLTSRTLTSLDYEALANEIKPSFKSTFLVHDAHQIIPIKTDGIAFFYGSGGQAWMFHKDKGKLPLSLTLNEITDSLDPTQFYRANRQFIVQRTFIDRVEHYFGRRLLLEMDLTPPEKILISKERATAFLDWLSSN